MINNPLFVVARFEVKTLLRSWFFRIFAILLLLFLVLHGIFNVSTVGSHYMSERVITGGILYLNLYYLNIAQSIVVIFLSSDFISRDKKLDTTVVTYVRSMSNFQYVFGKTLGIITVFGLFDLLIVILSIILHFVTYGAAASIVLYFIYPLIILLPTITFILGLSFFIMLVVKNQAITFALVLGYVIAMMVYGDGKLYNIFDSLAMFTPFIYSKFVGFTNLLQIVFLRGGYFIIGLGFVMLAVYKLPRLTQAKYGSKFTLFNSIIFLLLGFSSLGYYYWAMDNRESQILLMKKEFNTLPINAGYKINNYKIDLNKKKSIIEGVVEANVVATKEKNLPDTLKFLFNESLSVKIKINGKQVKYNRYFQIVSVVNPFTQKDSLKVMFDFVGTPTDKYSFFDLHKKVRNQVVKFNLLRFSPQYNFITDNFMMLTSECFWYPVVAERNVFRTQAFFKSELRVKCDNNLSVISQGKKTKTQDGAYVFVSDVPYNKISVVAGKYKQLTMDVDSVSYSVNTSNLDYIKHFTLLKDTLPKLISTFKQDYERKLGLKYPYKRFSIIEVPIHFAPKFRIWNLSSIAAQPEMIFITENGYRLFDFYLEFNIFFKRWNKQEYEKKTPKERQVYLFNQAISGTIAGNRNYLFNDKKQTGMDKWSPFIIFPLYYTYVYSMKNDDLPILNIAMERFVLSKLRNSYNWSQEDSPINHVIMHLKKGNVKLSDIINDDKKENSSIGYLLGVSEIDLAKIQLNIGYDNFNNFVDSLLNIGKNNALDTLFTFVEEVKIENSLPAFDIGEPYIYKFKKDKKRHFFVKLNVSNKSKTDGLISLSLQGVRFRSRRRRKQAKESSGSSYKKILLLKADSSYQVGFTLEGKPKNILINTFLSENLPGITNKNLQGNIEKLPSYIKPFDGIKSINDYTKDNKNVIVVDNEDKGFRVVDKNRGETLKTWLRNREKEDERTDSEYKRFRRWRQPSSWTPVLNANAYGKYIKSKIYRASGNGNSKVVFNANISVAGNYKVYAYMPSNHEVRKRNYYDKYPEFLFTVNYDNNKNEVKVPIKNNNPEWVEIGEYYFPKGDASVELSDKNNAFCVIADAVKWVKLDD